MNRGGKEGCMDGGRDGVGHLSILRARCVMAASTVQSWLMVMLDLGLLSRMSSTRMRVGVPRGSTTSGTTLSVLLLL